MGRAPPERRALLDGKGHHFLCPNTRLHEEGELFRLSLLAAEENSVELLSTPKKHRVQKTPVQPRSTCQETPPQEDNPLCRQSIIPPNPPSQEVHQTAPGSQNQIPSQKRSKRQPHGVPCQQKTIRCGQRQSLPSRHQRTRFCRKKVSQEI